MSADDSIAATTCVPIRLGAAGVAGVAAADWDALHDHSNVFVRHSFLSLLEDSGSVAPQQGWQAAPLLAETQGGKLLAAAPAYFKSHSQGEYVFDHGWAEAWHRAGECYYPKLQLAVPFTPVPGPRLLYHDETAAIALLRAAEQLVVDNQLSSAHATFIAPEQVALFADAGWLLRRDLQFHFVNPGYRDFNDFLGNLTAARRKQIRKERTKAQAMVRIEQISGAALDPMHWEAMWGFYQATSARKWGQTYLTRAAFDLLGERMSESTLLILAYATGCNGAGAPIAGALHFIGNDCLYGRYWGCARDIPYLHFELCYYQAIEFALAHGLARIEAGAQGGHKLARGYAPTATWSAHFIRDAGFHRAVASFLKQEHTMQQAETEFLATHLPFRQD